MAYEFELIRRIEFSDTDMAGIVHFSRFFVFMEAAEHAFWRDLGFSVHFNENGYEIGWARIKCECQYLAPLRFEDQIKIHLAVIEKKEKSLTYRADFYKLGLNPIKVAEGKMKVVCVKIDRITNVIKAIPIPKKIADTLEITPIIARHIHGQE